MAGMNKRRKLSGMDGKRKRNILVTVIRYLLMIAWQLLCFMFCIGLMQPNLELELNHFLCKQKCLL